MLDWLATLSATAKVNAEVVTISSSARAAVGLLRHLGQLCTCGFNRSTHRPLAKNAAEWPLSTSANACSRPKGVIQAKFVEG
jgi:hypothetical protein